METIFEHHIKTGSGWTKTILTFSDEKQAKIEFDSRWMGSDTKRYRFHCTHHPFSETYGLLFVYRIERYLSYDSNETEIVKIRDYLDDPEYYDGVVKPEKEITFEYIRLPKSEIWIASDPGLEELRGFFNLAKWNDTFDLILLFHFTFALYDEKFEDSEINAIISALDKMKFAYVSESRP